MIARLQALARLLATAALAVAGVLLGVMAAVVIYTVGQRYLLGRTPYWSEELPRLLLVWVTFLGMIYGVWRGTHLSSGLLPLIVRDAGIQRGVARLGAALTLVFAVAIGKAAVDLVQVTASHLTAAMQISAAWSYSAAAVGAGGVVVVAAVTVMRRTALR